MRSYWTLLIFISFSGGAQQIAITFDDSPTADSYLMTGEERSQDILEHLHSRGVSQVAFFVLTGNITRGNAGRLARFARAGHLLANHSHSHYWIHQAGTREYIRDVRQADSILSSLPGYTKWFRYPYLDEGRSVAARDSVRQALKTLKLSNGYVTIDNYDWYLNHLYVQAGMQNKEIHEDRLRKIYLEHIYNSIVFYDDMAKRHLGRSPKHVLLLHENDLAARFLGDLIDLIREKGWTIISPRAAYEDSIAKASPDVLFNGQGRVAAMAREKGVPARDLVQEAEDEIFLETLVEKEQVFGPAP